MRIFVIFEKRRISIDFPPDADVRTVREDIIEKTSANTTDNVKEDKILELTYGGGALNDDLILKDIGIGSGSTIRAALKIVQRPKLIILKGYDNHRKFHIMDPLEPVKTKIYDVKSIICRELGLPVTSFRLTKYAAKGTLVELFDCNTLYYYGIEIGATIMMDVWDGWGELIKTSINGHVKTISLYLSYHDAERHFQYRVILYIAAHYGHIGLASAMLKVGARPDIPIGSHPTRKWCNESDHNWNMKSPVHVASERGHLVILKMFVKSNILCLISKDEMGCTPWNIIVRKRHKDCFGYLLARQWGRKTAKDVSIPILTYCHVLRWCEKAKINALLKYGSSKSTFKGIPQKDGALVGTAEVVLDGFSHKPMNSKSFTKMPRPTMHPSQLMSALFQAKRGFKGRAPPLQRRASSRAVLNKLSSSETSSGNLFLTESPVFSDFPEQENGLNSSSIFNKKAVFISTGQLNSSYKKSYESLPADIARIPGNIRPLKHRASRVSFAQDSFHSVVSNNTSSTRGNSASQIPNLRDKKKIDKKKKAILKRKNSNLSDSGAQGGAVVPLPAISEPGFSRPYYYWDEDKESNPIEETIDKYRANADIDPRQNAINCVGVSSAFTKKPWLKQIDIALCLAKRGVTRQTIAV